MKRASMGEMELALSLRAQGASHAEVRNLVTVAGALALVPDPEIDAAFADALEARLLTEGIESSPEVTVLRPVRRAARPAAFAPKTDKMAAVVPLPRRRFVVRKAIAVAIAAAMMLALPIAAGAQSLPSSPLYKVKLGMESLRMHFTTGALAKGFYQLELARTRIEEGAQELALGHDAAAAEAIYRMRRHQSRGTELIMDSSPGAATLEEAESKLRSIVDQLASLLSKASGDVRPMILDAMRASEGLANFVSAPVSGLLVPSLVRDTAANQAPGAAGVKTESGSGDASLDRSGGDTAAPRVGDSNPDPNRTGHDVVDSGCSAPGGAELGDMLDPLAAVFCAD